MTKFEGCINYLWLFFIAVVICTTILLGDIFKGVFSNREVSLRIQGSNHELKMRLIFQRWLEEFKRGNVKWDSTAKQ
jgi:hypothetical protein